MNCEDHGSGQYDQNQTKEGKYSLMGVVNGGFDEMYLKYYEMVYRYICRAVRNHKADAEDLTQEVFWVAYQKWDRVKEHPNIGGFLMVVAKNKLMKWSVRTCPFYYEELEMLEALAAEMEEQPAPYGMIDLCSSVEATLSHEELDILLQYYSYGYTAAEMARNLGISEGCFKVRVLRMREKLRREIDLAILFFVLCGISLIK